MSKRLFLVGSRDYDDGVARPHCTGLCHGGREPCRCVTGETELSLELGPDDTRVIQPPKPEPAPNARARANQLVLAVVIALYLGLAALLRLFGARAFHS